MSTVDQPRTPPQRSRTARFQRSSVVAANADLPRSPLSRGRTIDFARAAAESSTAGPAGPPGNAEQPSSPSSPSKRAHFEQSGGSRRLSLSKVGAFSDKSRERGSSTRSPNANVNKRRLRKANTGAVGKITFQEDGPSADGNSSPRSLAAQKTARMKAHDRRSLSRLNSLISDRTSSSNAEVEVFDNVEKKDLAYVLQHIIDSGFCSTCYVPTLLPVLRQSTLFSAASPNGIAQALHSGHVIASPAQTLMWRWTGVNGVVANPSFHGHSMFSRCDSMKSSPSENSRGLFLVLSGQVAMLSCRKDGTTTMQAFGCSTLGDTDHDDVMALWAIDNSAILWMPKETAAKSLFSNQSMSELLLNALRDKNPWLGR